LILKLIEGFNEFSNLIDMRATAEGRVFLIFNYFEQSKEDILQTEDQLFKASYIKCLINCIYKLH
jgi:hypothetical protein